MHATGIVICADDFAMTAGISRAILDLLAADRLSATSVMVTRPHWPALAPHLMAFDGRADLGLHLDLTLGPPIGPMPHLAPDGKLPPLRQFLRRALVGRLDPREIETEIGRQLDAFHAATGRPPDHVDGHQHVHALPVVRAALFGALAVRGLAGRVYLRDPADTLTAIRERGVAVRKAIVIRMLASGFGRAAHRAGFRTNLGFAGVSAFGATTPYRDEFRRSLRARGPRHLVMCHPGIADAELAALDPVTHAREVELAYLGGAEFTEDLLAAGVVLARMS